MSESTFPRRDAEGRVEHLVELLASIVAGLVIGLAVLLVVDGLPALFGWGRFGNLSGWLAGILPIWLFVEDFRAWHAVPARSGIALFAAVMSLVLGFAAGNGAAGGLPPLGSGAVGVAVFAVVYGALWYAGIRWLADRSTQR